MPRDRPGRPDIDSQEGAWPQQFVIGNDEAELEGSEQSRSFVNRMNDQVRKRQKRISNFTEDGEKHFYVLVNVHDRNNGISSIHGKELPEQLSIHCEHNRSHTQTMLDISTRLVSEQDEISGLETIGWENHS